METQRDGDQSEREKGKEDHRQIQRHQGEEETSAVENKQVKGKKQWACQQEQDAWKGRGRESCKYLGGAHSVQKKGFRGSRQQCASEAGEQQGCQCSWSPVRVRKWRAES